MAQARDQALKPYIAAYNKRRRKGQLIAGALRELPACLHKLENQWDFEGATVESLAEELEPHIRKKLEAVITGDEPPSQVAMLPRQLVQRQLSATPAPAVAQ